MSHALLWVEALLASLLWAAAIIACAAHFNGRARFSGNADVPVGSYVNADEDVGVPGKTPTPHFNRRAASRLIVFFVGIAPFAVVFLGLCSRTATLKFGSKLEESRFGYALSLFLAYLICVIGLLILANRRPAPGLKRLAASWPRGRLALGLATTIAIGSMTLWNMDLEVRSQAGNLRNEAGALMLSVSPPNVADSYNAAPIYERAFARLMADTALVGAFSYAKLDLSDAEIQRALSRHQSTMNLLRKAALMPDCRFDRDYVHPNIAMMLPELNRARMAAELLALDARYEASHGHIDAAVADLNAIFQLSGAMAGEPFVVGFLVALGIDRIAVETMQDVLPGVTNTAQLGGLHVGDQSYISRALCRSMRGDEALGLATFGDVAGNRISIGTPQGMCYPESAWPRYWALIEPEARFLMRVFLIADDVAAYRELMESYEQAASEPYYRAPHDDSRTTLRRGLITSMIAPALSHTIQYAAHAQAAHAAAEVAVAMTRYRLDHGAVPKSLDRLVPDYLDEVPLDPFDGKPLRLVHKGDQWIIYSIGPDGKDDGGASYDYQSKKGDIPFILKVGK